MLLRFARNPIELNKRNVIAEDRDKFLVYVTGVVLNNSPLLYDFEETSVDDLSDESDSEVDIVDDDTSNRQKNVAEPPKISVKAEPIDQGRTNKNQSIYKSSIFSFSNMFKLFKDR